MAPNASFSSKTSETTPPAARRHGRLRALLQANSGGARIHSNSTETTTLGEYTTIDQDADRFLFDHEEMAIFFAAGNSGPGLTTTGSPPTRKQGISVGAVAHGSSTTLDGFSSRGPTADGRIKPDLVAEGQAIGGPGFSTHVSEICLTKRLSGTSMSCPTAAGASALLREYFADGFYRPEADPRRTGWSRWPPRQGRPPERDAPPRQQPGFGNSGYGWGRVLPRQQPLLSTETPGSSGLESHDPDGVKTGDKPPLHGHRSAPARSWPSRAPWSDVEGTLYARKPHRHDST